MTPSVAIWRNSLFLLSETFISQQADSLRAYRPFYVGRNMVHRQGEDRDNVVSIRDHGGVARRLEGPWYVATRQSPTLHRSLRARNPALIHAHFGVDGVYALPYKRRLGVPLITTFHGFDATVSDDHAARYRPTTWSMYLRHMDDLRREGDRFLAVSRYIRERVVELGFPRDRTTVHHIGVDLDRFAFRLPEDHPRSQRILAVNRLVEKKGTSYLIRAMASVVREHPDATLEIIGDGPLRPALEQLSADLGLAAHVRFLGPLPNEQVLAHLTRADIFALPSVTSRSGDMEGLPFSILEAAASGVPVVSTWHSGIPEAVIHGQSGLLVPERDAELLADALCRLLGDDELARRFARAGRQHMECHFSLRNQTAALERIYDEVVAQR